MLLRQSVAIAIVALSLSACGNNVGDAARAIDDAIEATTAAGRASDSQAEAAASRTICDALGAYSSEPAGLATDVIQAYAAQQQVASGLTLEIADPNAASRLADAAEAIESSQQATDVAANLAC